ncbi:HNH endonuclease signature motif containing protein [Gluconobacter sp. OJB]|uniref:HNH endonuclease signature motif containing protein n=1 Tax=Gluconobacter sp. OJB TaxID=3145196 RepID=UPI0031F8410C
MKKIQTSSGERFKKENMRAAKERSVSYDSKWAEFSKNYRAANPFCVECLEYGDFNTSKTHVDHIVPLEKSPELKYDLKNLRTLCSHHHGVVTRNFLNTGINEMTDKQKEDEAKRRKKPEI